MESTSEFRLHFFPSGKSFICIMWEYRNSPYWYFSVGFRTFFLRFSFWNRTIHIQIHQHISWLFISNFFFFQWFGVRLAEVTDIDTDQHLGWIWIKRFPLMGWSFK